MNKLCMITSIGLAEEKKVTLKEVGKEEYFTIYPDIETMKKLNFLVDSFPEEPILVEVNEKNEVIFDGKL